MADNDRQNQLINIVKEALGRDKELRDKYQIGEKFRFVQERLQKLLEHLEKNLAEANLKKEDKTKSATNSQDLLVYVYLFNAHGLDVRSWLRMLIAKRFYEYSVNRPIYLEEAHVESFVKHKANKVQHGYLVVAVNKSDLIQSDTAKDSLGQPLVKIKEGALHFEKLISFVHNGQSYLVNEDGEMIKKT